MKRWVLYIVRCKDKSLYTGITTDLKKRIKIHNQGKGAKYTKPRRPVKLVYNEVWGSESQAKKREIIMTHNQLSNDVDFETPAVYRIRVKGHIADQLSGQLGGMIITRAYSEEKHPMTILVGQVRDQAALSGVLNELYELHLPILTVESFSS